MSYEEHPLLLMVSECELSHIHHAFDEDFRGFRVDRVAIGAQSSHSRGSPMSQRECAGFNWPPPSIPASQPVSITPEAVSRAGPSEVAHFVNCAVSDRSGLPNPLPGYLSYSVALRCSQLSKDSLPPPMRGVGHPASHTTRPSSAFNGTSACALAPSFQSRVVGVGHPVEPVSDVRRADARRRKRDRPKGVTHGFHVSAYKVDPRVCVLARNLLSKDCWRIALRDEAGELGPEMALVVEACAFACGAEGLTGAGAGPDRSIIRPSSTSKCEGPDADAGEEVALGVSEKLMGLDVGDGAFVDHTRRDVAGRYQVAKPLRGNRVDLVVEDSQAPASGTLLNSATGCGGST